MRVTDFDFMEYQQFTHEQNILYYLSKSLTHTNMIHDRHTRQNAKNLLKLPKHRLETTHKKVFYGVKFYNDLPLKIREKTSLNSFKNNYKNFVIKNYEIV